MCDGGGVMQRCTEYSHVDQHSRSHSHVDMRISWYSLSC